MFYDSTSVITIVMKNYADMRKFVKNILLKGIRQLEWIFDIIKEEKKYSLSFGVADRLEKFTRENFTNSTLRF